MSGDAQFDAMLDHLPTCEMWQRDSGVCTCGHSPIAYYTWNGPGGALVWAHQTTPEHAAKMRPLFARIEGHTAGHSGAGSPSGDKD